MDTTPEILAKVRLNRMGSMYLVVDVDLDRQLVELLVISGSQRLVPNVPFAAIHEVVDEPPDYL